MNRFILNEVSYHQKGAINAIQAEVKSRNLQKAFLCTDESLVKFGVAEKVFNVLKKADIPYVVFSDIKANPTVKNVKDGLELFI